VLVLDEVAGNREDAGKGAVKADFWCRETTEALAFPKLDFEAMGIGAVGANAGDIARYIGFGFTILFRSA